MPLQPFQNLNFDLSKKEDGLRYQAQIASFLNGLLSQIQNGGFLAGILNGSGALNGSALATLLVDDLGAWTSPGTVNCSGYTQIFVGGSMTSAKTINFTNVAQGTIVSIYIRPQGANNLKCNFTDPGGATYTSLVMWDLTTGTTSANFATTGYTAAAGQFAFYSGMAGLVGGVKQMPFTVISN
jgi:hypothetical protein